MSRSSNSLVSVLQNAQALRKILQAFLRGGWKAAALEAVKRYWPYILGAAVALILLPTIIMASLPSVMRSKAPEQGCRSAAYIQRAVCRKPCADRQQYRKNNEGISAWVRKRFAYLQHRAGGK